MFRSSMSRRALLGAAGSLGLAAAVGGCASPGSTATNRETGAAATGEAKGEISFAHWRAEDKAAFDELITSFQTATPGVTVTQDITPSNDYQSQALNRLRNGSAGDVFPTFRGAQFEQFVKAGVYVSLAGQDVVGKYEDTLIEAGRQNGAQWGLPYQVVFPMPIANLEALDKAGVDPEPADWDAFLELCEKLKASGVTPIAWPGGDVGNAGQLFNVMVMNNTPADDTCAKIEEGQAKVTDDWFIDTLKQYQQLTPYFQTNAVGSAVEPTQQLFASGKAAMLATGSYHIAAVRTLGATFDIDLVAPITTTAAKARYEGSYNATFILGVNAASKVQPAAVAWLNYLSDPAQAAIYADKTVQHVTVADVEYTNADLKRLAPWLTRKNMLAPRFQFLNLDIRNAVEGACIKVVGGTSPDEAAEAAQKIIDQLT